MFAAPSMLGKSGYPYPAAGRICYMDMATVRTVDVLMPAAEMQAALSESAGLPVPPALRVQVQQVGELHDSASLEPADAA